MPSQVMGYYRAHQGKLLKDFDRTAARLKASLIVRYGKDFAGTLKSEVRQEYGQLIQEIP